MGQSEGWGRVTIHGPRGIIMYMKTINLPITEELLEAVDEARGDVPRTVWIRRAIEQRLDREKQET
jgi:hypothetical protein